MCTNILRINFSLIRLFLDETVLIGGRSLLIAVMLESVASHANICMIDIGREREFCIVDLMYL